MPVRLEYRRRSTVTDRELLALQNGERSSSKFKVLLDVLHSDARKHVELLPTFALSCALIFGSFLLLDGIESSCQAENSSSGNGTSLVMLNFGAGNETTTLSDTPSSTATPLAWWLAALFSVSYSVFMCFLMDLTELKENRKTHHIAMPVALVASCAPWVFGTLLFRPVGHDVAVDRAMAVFACAMLLWGWGVFTAKHLCQVGTFPENYPGLPAFFVVHFFGTLLSCLTMFAIIFYLGTVHQHVVESTEFSSLWIALYVGVGYPSIAVVLKTLMLRVQLKAMVKTGAADMRVMFPLMVRTQVMGLCAPQILSLMLIPTFASFLTATALAMVTELTFSVAAMWVNSRLARAMKATVAPAVSTSKAKGGVKHPASSTSVSSAGGGGGEQPPLSGEGTLLFAVMYAHEHLAEKLCCMLAPVMIVLISKLCSPAKSGSMSAETAATRGAVLVLAEAVADTSKATLATLVYGVDAHRVRTSSTLGEVLLLSLFSVGFFCCVGFSIEWGRL